MVELFNTPKIRLWLPKKENILHGKSVKEFEQEFCQYVGAKHACSFNSASSAIFLLFNRLCVNVKVPSIIPPVVVNHLLNGGNTVELYDDIDWVGRSYVLHEFEDVRIVDSAQEVQKSQYKYSKKRDSDIFIYSFYPTKPIGSCDGGIIVSNDPEHISKLRIDSMNGMTNQLNNWDRKIVEPGYKMYMNTIQARIALKGLRNLDKKKNKLKRIRDIYNNEFSLENTSEHLYRIHVADNTKTMHEASAVGITMGIHYRAIHLNPVYSKICGKLGSLERSEIEGNHTISIPYHENLSDRDIKNVCKFIKQDYRTRGNPDSNRVSGFAV
jgi:dTDP-4-amino-4,6-dideoxygalactose transaminase